MDLHARRERDPQGGAQRKPYLGFSQPGLRSEEVYSSRVAGNFNLRIDEQDGDMGCIGEALVECKTISGVDSVKIMGRARSR